MHRAFLAFLYFGFVAPSHGAAAVDYIRDVKPILSARCFACHSAVRQKAGLRLDALSLIHKGSKSNQVIVPGKAAQSLLLDAVLGKDRGRMPPEKEGAALSADEIATLRSWIDQGAKGPTEPIPPDPRNHWAFRPPVKIPMKSNINPIDAFITAARQKHDGGALHPNPPADRAILLRRVYLDLIGVPPTREELHAFLADKSPDAYEKVVDRVLASPQYGERWGRHWMDVWRYSDPFGNGQEFRYSQRHIWRWRDWIIESLNADKGYDRMIVEMLAGDEVAPADPKTLRATGYLARNWYKFNRNAWMQDTVEYTAAGFLGLTLRCARCHDHKYDPLPQQDYYRFRAFFEPHDIRIDPVPGQPDILKDGIARAFDAHASAATYLFQRGDERMPDKSRALTPSVPGVLGGDLVVKEVPLEGPDLLRALGPAADKIRAAAQTQASQEENVYTPLVQLSPATSTGRRLALAQWITSRNNPLTARVAVNHIWMRHFGKPLVASVANFGLTGQKPTHPELLDTLAVDFMDSGWSMKKLHRLMVTSATYRLGSQAADTANVAADPENRYLWRMNPRRMEAEAVRDSLLSTAGQLDRTMGGPILDETKGQTSRRRSIYFRFNTEYRIQFLDPFDAASTMECFERKESIIPQQALALSNSVLALNQSRLLARQLTQAAPEAGAFVIAAFEQVLGRPPTNAEKNRCERFLREQAEVVKDPGKLQPFPAGPDSVTAPAGDSAQRARENLIQVLYNHNDFVTIR